MPEILEKRTEESPRGAFAPRMTPVDRSVLTPILQKVEQPGRYCGGEFGIPVKDPALAKVSVALTYPDTYELGMSNQGLRILYDIVNRRQDMFADRVFLPWPDFAREIKSAGLPLYSLDHFLAVKSFDVWGFNTAHELHYTNLLFALDLAGIPLLRKDRTEQDPFIITGGTAVSNPLPIFDFMDGIFLGDGEDGLIEMMEVIARGKKAGKSRAEILVDLQTVEGLLLPEFYKTEKTQGNPPFLPSPFPAYLGRMVKKRTYRSTEYAHLQSIVVPNIEITQDRLVVEVNRGCAQSCRFCHAGFWKRPVRHTEVETLIKNAGDMLLKTGQDSISLHSLSIADYPWLEELVVGMAQAYGPSGVSLSLPSLRVQVKTIPVLEMTSGIRKSSVTFALESGSEFMREKIFKKSSEENLHYLMREIFSRGWDLVKVYFMLGLPDRDDREVDDLIHALNALGDLARECGQKKNVNVTVSLFVPKPFTTFQWEEQKGPDFFIESIKKIKANLKSNRVHIKSPDPWMSYVEGFLSRSDHRAGKYILEAFQKGARFDSWDDQFKKDIWIEVMGSIPSDILDSWMKEKPGGTDMPWDNLVDGYPREKLIKDYKRFEAVTEENMNPPHKQALVPSDFPPELLKPVFLAESKFETKSVLGIEFAKTGSFIYVSHLDTVEVVRKACRRSRIPMTFSRGFNKHEKFHFTGPIPLFIHSESEWMYVEISEEINLAEIHPVLSRNFPDGLKLLSLKTLDAVPAHKPAENPPSVYRLDFADKSVCEKSLSLLLDAPEEIAYERISRKKKHKRQKLRNVTRRLSSAMKVVSSGENFIRLELEAPDRGAISLADLLSKYLGLPQAVWNTAVTITRLAQ